MMRPMPLRFVGCNAFIGSAQKGTWKPGPDRAALLAQMDVAGIDTALIWHVGQRDRSIQEGNALASAAVGSEERLRGCWRLPSPKKTSEASCIGTREACSGWARSSNPAAPMTLVSSCSARTPAAPALTC